MGTGGQIVWISQDLFSAKKRSENCFFLCSLGIDKEYTHEMDYPAPFASDQLGRRSMDREEA